MLEANVDLYSDKLHHREIKKNFREMLEKLKNSSKNNRKKNVQAQVEALEEKLKPFMDLNLANDQGNRAEDSNSAPMMQQENTGAKMARSGAGNAMQAEEDSQPADNRRRKDHGRQNKRAQNRIIDEDEDEREEVPHRPTLRSARNQRVVDENDSQAAPLPPRRPAIVDEEMSSGKKPKKKANKQKANQKKPKARRIIKDSDEEDGDEDEPELDDDDEDYEN